LKTASKRWKVFYRKTRGNYYTISQLQSRGRGGAKKTKGLRRKASPVNTDRRVRRGSWLRGESTTKGVLLARGHKLVQPSLKQLGEKTTRKLVVRSQLPNLGVKSIFGRKQKKKK